MRKGHSSFVHSKTFVISFLLIPVQVIRKEEHLEISLVNSCSFESKTVSPVVVLQYKEKSNLKHFT